MNLISGDDGVPFDRGSWQVGLQYRLKGVKFNPRLYAYYSSGYGDTMLEYKDYKSTFRVGIAFF